MQSAAQGQYADSDLYDYPPNDSETAEDAVKYTISNVLADRPDVFLLPGTLQLSEGMMNAGGIMDHHRLFSKRLVEHTITHTLLLFPLSGSLASH